MAVASRISRSHDFLLSGFLWQEHRMPKRTRLLTEFPDFTKTLFQGFRFSARRVFPLSGFRGFGCSRSSPGAKVRLRRGPSEDTTFTLLGSCSRDSGISRFRDFWRSWFHRFGRRCADDADVDPRSPKCSCDPLTGSCPKTRFQAIVYKLYQETGVSGFRGWGTDAWL
jgi:hypothetical protein